MNGKIKSSTVCVFIGAIVSFACLYKTTPITMTLFFFAGLPAFAAGIFLYLYFVISVLMGKAEGGKI